MTGLINIQTRLVAPQGQGNTSAVCLSDAWYVACRAKDLGRHPLAVTILGQPLVLFRDGSGAPVALMDRCPHRNVPLSLGRVCDGELECAYHGWRFDSDGLCARVPGLSSGSETPSHRVDRWAAREQQGLIWVYGEPNVKPDKAPYHFPHVGQPGYHTVYDTVEAQGTLHAVAENALDVPHTAFLHRGLFRKDGERRPIDVVIRRGGDRVEAEFVGEKRPSGLIGSILAPGGGTVEHFDRFILPCIVEVEYRLGDRSHLIAATALTPIDDFHTRLFAVVSFRLPLPAWLVSPFVKPLARRIFAQDARILEAQTESIRRFGGEQFVSTEIDALGPYIRRLLLDAEKGRVRPSEQTEVRRFRLLV